MNADLLRLIDRYLDGDVSPAEIASLEAALDADATLVDALAARAALTADLRRVTTRSASTSKLEMRNSIRSSIKPDPSQLRAKVGVPKDSGSRFAIPVSRFAAVAAALVFLAAAVAIYLAVSSTDPQTEIRDPRSPAASIASILDASDNATLVVNNNVAAPGSDIAAGDIALNIGSADFRLTNGVNVRLTGATRLTLHDTMSATLAHGAARFECPPSAHGYTVHMPNGVRVVDLGTEFSVNANDKGGGSVTVYVGRVELRSDRWTERLEAGAQVGWGADGGPVVLTRGGGERTTLAHWRFEDHDVGDWVLPAVDADGPSVAARDAGPVEAHLFVFEAGTAPLTSGDIPAKHVPAIRGDNRRSIDLSSPPSGDHLTRDLYTTSERLRDAELTEWTVEASIKPIRFTGDRHQTFICRDGARVVTDAPELACFYLQVAPQGHPAVAFADAAGRFHKLVANEVTLEPGRWCHIAATSDGRTLTLLVDTLDGRGYRIAARRDLPADGFAMTRSGGAWAVGRGWFDGKPADQFVGLIDEVRISDAALPPDRLLFAESPGANVAP